jgi:ankyrin repeat protein
MNGPLDDGEPIMTALAFGYPDAAETLVRRGARVDNVVGAAALGRLELVKTFFEPDGRPRADAPARPVRWVPAPQSPKVLVDWALIHASKFGHAAVVDFLLRMRADPRLGDEQGLTALHWAAWSGHIDVMESLIRGKAPLEARNVYGGTVLDFTAWASLNAPRTPDYVPVVQCLLRAGADVAGVRPFPSGNRPIDDLLARR